MFGKKNKLSGFTPTPTYNDICKSKLAWGFTLVELLLALTIFSIVASLVYSSFRLGVISWRRLEANSTRCQNIRYALNRMSSDLANAFKHSAIKFQGMQDKIEFAACPSSFDKSNTKICKIIYSITEGTAGNGSTSITRSILPYWDAVKENEEEIQEEKTIFLSDVLDFKISYCFRESQDSELEWLAQWQSEEYLPAGVKVEIILKDDYAPGGKRAISKRIFIPAGKIGKPEGIGG